MASKQAAVKPSMRPSIASIEPASAIRGGEFHIRGKNLAAAGRPLVRFGDEPGHLVVAGNSYIIARVPETATVGEVVVSTGNASTEPAEAHLGIQVADSLHPVANPAVDAEGNIFSTFSGSRGQKSPVSIYKVDAAYNSKPFVTDLMNPTGLAIDPDGLLYVSSRYDGMVYQITTTGNMSVFVEGMGVATGIAFDPEQNLYVGDRSGTIFKISPARQIYVFATLEPSIAAYHLAFGPDNYLYVSGPTTSSFDSVYRISQAGEVETYFRGLGRPQGLAFDKDGRLYVAASLAGRRGIIRIEQSRDPEVYLSGPGIVGIAFSPSKAMIVATHNALYRVDAEIAAWPLFPN
jgi:glucose/arabinose dehydrogenase